MKHLLQLTSIASLLITSLALTSCNNSNTGTTQAPKESSIDTTLQNKVDTFLHSKMTEVNAISGQAIVMEVNTGQIKAIVGTSIPHKSALVKTANILAALETGKVQLSDAFNTNGGVYHTQDTTLRDHNWHRGGYGVLTIKETLSYSSQIGVYRTLEHAFDDSQTYFNTIDSLGYGQPDNIEGLDHLTAARRYTTHTNQWRDLISFCIGDNQAISPIQTLTFHNAIANGGCMVKPSLYKDEPEILATQMASPSNIDSIQSAMRYAITNGLGRRASTDLVAVAGIFGGSIISEMEDTTDSKENTELLLQFCGYFPAEAPKYSIIVCMTKKGFPASSGAMCGPVFKDIVEYMHPRY